MPPRQSSCTLVCRPRKELVSTNAYPTGRRPTTRPKRQLAVGQPEDRGRDPLTGANCTKAMGFTRCHPISSTSTCTSARSCTDALLAATVTDKTRTCTRDLKRPPGGERKKRETCEEESCVDATVRCRESVPPPGAGMWRRRMCAGETGHGTFTNGTVRASASEASG